MQKTICVELWGKEHRLTIPELPPGAIPPGAFRGDILALFRSFLGRYPLKTMEECARDRAEHHEHWDAWVQAHYTWNHFLREAPHLSAPAAHHLATVLLSRDVLAETQGGLLGDVSEKIFEQRLGMPSLQTYLITLINTAARCAWWQRVQTNGLPDPKVDPLPPVRQADHGQVQSVLDRRIRPFLDTHLGSKGYTRSLEALSALILYVLGYLAEKPQWVSLPDGVWQEALHGFLKPPHAPFLWMLHAPGAYLNAIAEEGHEGKHNGFFSTPVSVVQMMAAITGATGRQTDLTGGHYRLVDGLWECLVPGETPEARRKSLEEHYSDPCVGAGNMLWGILNQAVFGEFIDINPALVHATKALCAMHAPWFVHKIYRANALSLPAVPAEIEAVNQSVRAGILEQVRAEYTLTHTLAERAQFQAPPDWTPDALRAAGMDEDTLFAHIEARANARLAEGRKGYLVPVHGAKLDVLRQLLADTPESAPPPPPRTTQRAARQIGQRSLFNQ